MAASVATGTVMMEIEAAGGTIDSAIPGREATIGDAASPASVSSISTTW
ncbi:MAG TPA: hypothetical protein VEQ36_07625 [Thermomicrobiales bacterium]|nr:hypothetical protein [Thermomicrobiales bacterium]